ncbi:ER lumen protein-retaining receptor 1-A-like [Phymastichus coffea]|uniref:ER lumen protein-retaining receptor 1-A-like n=1 Tax=Phymastichus coffea TaxID=108790 RepID=UPI00273B90EA|nr:ER lumen protein-retaining receptor 1-A-like [Phymastichus coffea]
MDLAQVLGDYMHLTGLLFMLINLVLTKECAGISGKAQLLYALSFTVHYIVLLFYRYTSVYDAILQTSRTSFTYLILMSIFILYKNTYNDNYDAFRIELLIIPCAMLALFLNEGFTTFQVFTAFGVYLESVAIVPQTYFISKAKQVEPIVLQYVGFLTIYRVFYLIHWIYMYSKLHEFEDIAIATTLVQLVFYCDFFVRNFMIPNPSSRRPSSDNGAMQKMESDEGTAISDALLIADGKNNHLSVDITTTSPQPPLPKEDRVTLLTSNDHGTSN